MKPGTLVIPRSRETLMYLTPLNDAMADDMENWIEWKPEDVGIILPPHRGQIGVLVMVPNGSGLCFYDELIEVTNAPRRSRSA